MSQTQVDLILDGSVTAIDLASSAVTTEKIADANVTTEKIANSSITKEKLASDIVTGLYPFTTKGFSIPI